MPVQMEPCKFIKQPVEIEAFRFQGWTNALQITKWSKGAAVFVPTGYEHRARKEHELDRSTGNVLDRAPAFMIISTLEGDMRADVHDMIVRGVNGEFYPVKPDIFDKTYNTVEA